MAKFYYLKSFCPDVLHANGSKMISYVTSVTKNDCGEYVDFQVSVTKKEVLYFDSKEEIEKCKSDLESYYAYIPMLFPIVEVCECGE